MFKSKILFVVGAGASYEVGLPVGTQLKDHISELLNIKFKGIGTLASGDLHIVEAIRRQVKNVEEDGSNINSYIHSAHHIREALSLASSIDNLIDIHNNDDKMSLCGKLAIIKSIAIAENRSKMFVDINDRFDFSKLNNTWYNKFFIMLSENVKKENLESIFDNVSFIIFNYDRCVEHYLFNAIQKLYLLNSIETENTMRKLKVYHPYGVIGRLPWQESLVLKVPFGAYESGLDLLELSGQVKTFTERYEDKFVRDQMRNAVQEAETIVFLGFSFHPQNMKLICPNSNNVKKRVFATGKGISQSDCDLLTKQLFEFNGKLNLTEEVNLRNDLTCSLLFDEFWRQIPS